MTDRAVPRGGVIKADWTASDFPKYISADSLAVVGCLELRGLAERPPLPLSPSRECFSALATRVNSVDEHKSSWKNFPSVGRARTIRNRQLYRSSRQPEKGEGGPRRGLKGWSWNCGPHSRVKAAVLRSRILDYRLCTFEVSWPVKTASGRAARDQGMRVGGRTEGVERW